MRKLQPNEVLLVGTWMIDGGKVELDAVGKRIEWLISNDLIKIKDSPKWGAWEVLYQDKNDQRYWEKTYPQGELQGGGPPKLQCISSQAAQEKYDP